MTRSVTGNQRQQVIELKRQHSHNEVSRMTGLPLGTVRTIVRRSGLFTDNPVHAELFTLPPIQHSASKRIAAFVMPVQRTVTGDLEIDAVLWLREVISTGDPLAIDTALQAVANIKTPLKDIADRYAAYLREQGHSVMEVVLKTIRFDELDGLAEKSKTTAARKAEALARFGDDPVLMTEAERWAIRVLDGVDVGLMNKSQAEIAGRFKQHPELMPHTLADCLYELSFWDELYCLKMAADAGEPAQECYERGYFVFDLMAKIRPRNKDEAKAVLFYLLEHDRKDDSSANAILENLLS